MSGVAVDVEEVVPSGVQLASCVGQDDVSGSRLNVAVVQEVGIRASPGVTLCPLVQDLQSRRIDRL